MKKLTIYALIFIQFIAAFDILGALNLGEKQEEISEVINPKIATGVMLYFHPKGDLFNLPTCLRNLADIVEEIQTLNMKNSLEFALEKVIERTAKYTEMLFSCGFAFQYQMFFNLFTTVMNSQQGYSQGSCGESSQNCGQEHNENQKEEIPLEASFFKKIKPCALKIKEISEMYLENREKGESNQLEELRVLIQSIRFCKECQFQVVRSVFDSSTPCVESFEKVIKQFNEIRQSSNLYLGLVYSGASLIAAFNEMLFICKDPLFHIINPFSY